MPRRINRFLQIPEIKKILKKNLSDKNTPNADITLGNLYLFINNHAKRRATLFIHRKKFSRDTDGKSLSLVLIGAFRNLLKARDGIIIHAAGLEKAKNAFIFIGPSGRGKSTICKLLKDWPIFSDDNTIIKRDNGSFKAFSSPWNNEDCPKKRLIPPRYGYPLKAIFFLEKSDRVRLERISLTNALARLLYEDMPFHQAGLYDTRKGLTFFALFCMDLLKETRAFRLFFKNDRYFENRFTSLLKKEGFL